MRRLERQPATSEAGFSLIELLVAMAVLGLVLVLTGAGVRFGREALERQARDSFVQDQLAPAADTLRALISRAWPDAGGAQASFDGTVRMLSFRTELPETWHDGQARDADVQIGVDRAHTLYLSWLPWYRQWLVPKPPAHRIDLLGGVERIELSYWDRSLNLPAGQWVAAWTGGTAPSLVRLRIVLQGGTKTHWPDLIVAVARDRTTF